LISINIGAVKRILVASPNYLAKRGAPRAPEDLKLHSIIAFTGLMGGLGHLAVARAHRHASAAVLGPFLYQQILYMALGGWLVFSQVPDGYVIAGALVVVLSGLYLLWLEMRRR